MTIEELKELIDKVGKDKLPLNVFTIEDDDPHVLLGKMLIIEKALKEYHNIASENIEKSNEAINKADEAIETSNRAVSSIGSNPNLLINGDFRVNQRGQTSYSGDNSIKYFVDRWCFYWSSGFSYDTQSKLLTATSNGSIAQYIEDSQQLLGKTLTLSCKVNGTIYYKTATLNSSYNSDTYIIDENIGSTGFKMQLYWKSSSLLRVYIATNSAPASITIDYVKLEIGSVATALSPRPYAEELAMCQRYYLTLMNGASVYNGFIFTETNARISVPVPTTMRLRTPTAELKVNDLTQCKIYSNGTQVTPTALVYAGFVDSDQFVINATIPNATPNHTCAMRLLGSASLDAEIY